MEYGLQLYSVRDAAKENFEEMLAAVAGLGYTLVESAGFFGRSAAEVKATLDALGLTLVSTHTGYADVVNKPEEVIAFHRELGCCDVVIPSAPLGTKDEVDAFVDAVNRVQPIYEAAGMRLHYHNHSSEFLQSSDGIAAEYEIIDRTSLGIELDIFWAYHAGVDPVAFLEKYRDRIRMIHLKDGTSEGGRAIGKSLGLGTAPILAARAKAIECGMTVIVESEGLDPTGLEEVARCIEFLKGIDE